MKIFYVLLATLGLSVTAQGSTSENSVNFINKMIEKRGMHGCRKVISDIFQGKNDDVRVNTSVMPGEKNALKITVTHGRKGDSMMTDVFLRKLNDKCIANVTAIMTSSKSCLSCLGKIKGYKVSGECADFTEFLHDKGGTMYMKPMGNGCIVTMLSDFRSVVQT
tara:strand:+ start:969 stop:1460 length:492 start_codon:yes stop_codon:yes gene_type:complete